jgi:hypothetical protein
VEKIYKVRNQSLEWVSAALTAENTLFERGLDYTRRQIEISNDLSHIERESDGGVFVRIVGSSLAKAHRFLIAIYELNLTGLAQEAGALLRPTIEIIEALLYLSKDPSRVNEVLTGTLPSAGEIGKKISGNFKNLRDYLNTNASHFSFTEESMKHIVDFDNIMVMPDPKHALKVFKANLINILLFQFLLLRASAECLATCNLEPSDEFAEMDAWDKEVLALVRSALQADGINERAK